MDVEIIDKKLSLEFSGSKLSKIILKFPMKTEIIKIEIKKTTAMLFFYAVLQSFLQGQLESEQKSLELAELYEVIINSKKVRLRFSHFGNFIFKKVSENNRQYLLIEVTQHTAIAKKDNQDKIGLSAFKEYTDQEFKLSVPNPLRLTRFQAQYCYIILSKVRYEWNG